MPPDNRLKCTFKLSAKTPTLGAQLNESQREVTCERHRERHAPSPVPFVVELFSRRSSHGGDSSYGLRVRALFVLRVVFFDFAGAAFVFAAVVLVAFALPEVVAGIGFMFVGVGSVVAGASGGSVAPPPLTQAFQPPSSGRTRVKP